MRPARRLLHLLLIWVAVAVAASFLPRGNMLWLGSGAVTTVIVLADGLAGLAARRLTLERRIPGRFALGVADEVALTLRNGGAFDTKAKVFDGIPGSAEAPGLPWRGVIPSRNVADVRYAVKLLQRGRVVFSPAHVAQESPLGFWERRYELGDEAEVRVYPNYEPVVRFALLATDSRQNQMGILHKNRVGMSREFQQLREYHEGDVLSQIDWKATAKRRELISREYREQRDQSIIMVLDCGRRMRAMDGAISQFDHCLNAMLLLAFIALRQGDHVGLLGFGGGVDRWLPPVKGQHAMTTLLNHLYDYETTTSPSDFSEAAEKLMARQRRRALVVLLTNLRSEDTTELLAPLRIIKRNHLPLLASLRESSVEALLERRVETFEDALACSATQLYLEEREHVFHTLRSHGVLTLDEQAGRLPIALTNRYLDIKASGRL